MVRAHSHASRYDRLPVWHSVDTTLHCKQRIRETCQLGAGIEGRPGPVRLLPGSFETYAGPWQLQQLTDPAPARRCTLQQFCIS